MCQCSTPDREIVRPSIRMSVHDQGELEAKRHKWIESEKAGHDIGFEKALLDWIVKHRAGWRALRQGRPSAVGETEPHKKLQAA